MNKKIFLGALLSTSAVAIATPTICATTMQNKNKTLQVNSRFLNDIPGVDDDKSKYTDPGCNDAQKTYWTGKYDTANSDDKSKVKNDYIKLYNEMHKYFGNIKDGEEFWKGLVKKESEKTEGAKKFRAALDKLIANKDKNLPLSAAKDLNDEYAQGFLEVFKEPETWLTPKTKIGIGIAVLVLLVVGGVIAFVVVKTKKKSTLNPTETFNQFSSGAGNN